MKEKPWRSNHGEHLEAEASRRHPGGTQEAPKETPSRHPGGQRGLVGKVR